MEEVRIDGHKMDFPERMTGEETENARAQMFYAATSKLLGAKKKISARGRIKKLAEYCNLAYLGDLESESLADLYSWIGSPRQLHIKLICQKTVRSILDSRIPTKSSH